MPTHGINPRHACMQANQMLPNQWQFRHNYTLSVDDQINFLTIKWIGIV